MKATEEEQKLVRLSFVNTLIDHMTDDTLMEDAHASVLQNLEDAGCPMDPERTEEFGKILWNERERARKLLVLAFST